MTVESDMKNAELEIRAWLAPATSPREIVSSLLEAYQVRNSEEKEAFVVALIGRVLIMRARANVENVSPSATAFSAQ